MIKFLKRKDIEISVKRYLVDAMGHMALGLFSSLLIGTILNTIGSKFGLTFLTEVLWPISRDMTGAAIGVAVAYALKAPPLVLFSSVVTGAAGNAVGGPAGAFLSVLVATECGKLVSKETKVDILVTPAVTVFVGVFIARISKGRTIREFIMGVMLAPALASFVWFSIFGTLGLNLGINGTLSMEEMGEIAANPSVGLFVVFSKYPLGLVLSIIAIVLLCTFFITSANSGTFVLSMLTSNGNLNPPQRNKIIWGVLQAATAIGLLRAGGLKPLQTISIVAAFPFIFIMVMTAISTIKALKNDEKLKK